MALFYFNILKKTYLLLFYIFILLLSIIIAYFVTDIYPINSDIFDSFSQFFIYIPYFIWKKYKNNENIKHTYIPIKKTKKSSKIKDYIIFILIIICGFIEEIVYAIEDDISLSIYSLFNRYNIQIIFFSFLSKYALNTRYYIHHLISQILFEFLAILADYFFIIKRKGFKIDFTHILLAILDMMLEAIVLIYKKYLIEVEFYSVEYISFIFGLSNFIFLSIFYFIFENNICLNNTCIDIINFEFSWEIIISFICCSIFYIFFYKIIYHFSPVHILIFYIMSEFLLNLLTLFEEGLLIGFTLIIIYIFIIISFLIFVEIIELNFCGLNKYTRRNIMKRQQEEIADIGYLEIIEDNEDWVNITTNKKKKDKKKKKKEKETEIVDLPFGYSFELH